MRNLLTAAIALGFLSASARAEIPAGWKLLTSSPKSYHGQQVREGARSGRGAGALRGDPAAGRSAYGLLAQKISAVDFRGRQVRLQAYLRTDQVKGRAGLWLRVDDRQGQTLAFSNMRDRPIYGTRPWAPIALELEVPPEAHELHFGLLLQGAGEATIDDLELTALGPASPTATARSKVRALPRVPVNGDFEL